MICFFVKVIIQVQKSTSNSKVKFNLKVKSQSQSQIQKFITKITNYFLLIIILDAIAINSSTSFKRKILSS